MCVIDGGWGLAQCFVYEDYEAFFGRLMVVSVWRIVYCAVVLVIVIVVIFL